jgi:hypothetical protein
MTVEDTISLEQQLSDVERGDLATLKSAIVGQAEMARVAQADQGRVKWRLSDEAERQLFEDGSFVRELLRLAELRELTITEQDGQLLCYPVIVRVDTGKRAVTIDRKPHREVRPSVLVAHLAALQAKPVTAKPEPFLEALHTAWEYARHRGATGRHPAIDVRVNYLWSVLTVSPGSKKEYTKQDFGRDLYMLELSGARETKSGTRVHFSRSTGTKEAGAIVISGQSGDRIVYSSVGFTRRDAE